MIRKGIGSLTSYFGVGRVKEPEMITRSDGKFEFEGHNIDLSENLFDQLNSISRDVLGDLEEEEREILGDRKDFEILMKTLANIMAKYREHKANLEDLNAKVKKYEQLAKDIEKQGGPAKAPSSMIEEKEDLISTIKKIRSQINEVCDQLENDEKEFEVVVGVVVKKLTGLIDVNEKTTRDIKNIRTKINTRIKPEFSRIKKEIGKARTT